MSTTTAPASGAIAAPPARRGRFLLLAVLLTVTSAYVAVGSLLWTTPTADWFGYSDVAPVRATWWLNLTALGAAIALTVPLQVLAIMSLVRRRGAPWVTIGSLLAWVGSALLAVTLGGWASTYYVATDPKLDPAVATALLDRFADDVRLFGVGQPGSLMISIGTILVSVGLLRSRAVPRWIPIVLLATVAGTFLPSWGPVSLVANVPGIVVAVALAWYAYRRAAA